MAMQNEPNIGRLPCLVCGERYHYLTAEHLSSPECESGEPTDIESYRTWVAEEFDLDPDDPIFEDEQLLKPQYYRSHAARLDLPL